MAGPAGAGSWRFSRSDLADARELVRSARQGQFGLDLLARGDLAVDDDDGRRGGVQLAAAGPVAGAGGTGGLGFGLDGGAGALRDERRRRRAVDLLGHGAGSSDGQDGGGEDASDLHDGLLSDGLRMSGGGPPGLGESLPGSASSMTSLYCF